MAAQLYANTQLALALYEVLQELVEEGKVPEPLAVATLAQVGTGLHHAGLDCWQKRAAAASAAAHSWQQPITAYLSSCLAPSQPHNTHNTTAAAAGVTAGAGMQAAAWPKPSTCIWPQVLGTCCFGLSEHCGMVTAVCSMWGFAFPVVVYCNYMRPCKHTCLFTSFLAVPLLLCAVGPVCAGCTED